MKILKAESFRTGSGLGDFVNSKKIAKEDILIITMDENWYTLFYYE